MSASLSPSRPTASFDIWAPRILAALRVITGLLFVEHGTQKLFAFPVAPAFPLPLPFSLLWIGAILETVGGLFVAVGLFTRPVAVLLSGEMAVAYFLFHAPRGFFPVVNGGDSAILYCFIFLYLAAAGPGAGSFDRTLRR
ncbi:MAG: DoxX family protein [Acetobacteraceae bacterium]|nr:DoxX family protein [Acetobacteraceae bacterium]